MELIIMRNILVTGSNGQLGSDIRDLSSNYDYSFFFTDVAELDITDKKAIESLVKENSINTIINCAAYTAVDRAEEDSELADRINHQAVRVLGEISKERDISLIHISTDYVFDGESHRPYIEDDKVAPQSVYGETKLLSEQALAKINPQNSIIIRTSWVYSSYGNNFVKTMLRLGKERDELGVIFDQIGTPTYAWDLAKAILDILPQIENSKLEICHYSNEGVLSWYDFAKEIMRMAKIECAVNPIETKAYPTPAKRPHYSLLNKTKIKDKFNITIPYWKDSLDKCLVKMGERR
jgi:dTDP-4-dehydrorhamnose reductase